LFGKIDTKARKPPWFFGAAAEAVGGGVKGKELS